jgi:hypothetical protein
MKLDLKVRPFHPLNASDLSDADMNAQKDACRALLAAFRSQHARGTVLFMDECILEPLSFGLRRIPIFMNRWRETHLMLWCDLDRVQYTSLALSSFTSPLP